MEDIVLKNEIIKELRCEIEDLKLKSTYNDIKKANEAIVMTDIKGKNYAGVNQRIKAFRMVHPEGKIKTRMISNENGICIFEAEVYSNRCTLLATGTAYEVENSSFINKTSYIENCETSAVGRALGIAGFGIETSIASAEEIQNTETKQEEMLKTLAKMNDLIAQTNTDYTELLKYFGVESNSDMTLQQLKSAIAILEKKVK